ncbi:MAG: hypothetical protein QUS07_07385 [Methanothrix sp.]|nr:hypothetical protein [Methanothrix sp.]
MPDLIKDLLTSINAVFALIIIVLSIVDYRREHRRGYLWVWIVLGLVGVTWLAVYTPGVLDFFGVESSTRDLMGTGLIRSAVTLTLGSIISIMMLLRIPRKP